MVVFAGQPDAEKQPRQMRKVCHSTGASRDRGYEVDPIGWTKKRQSLDGVAGKPTGRPEGRHPFRTCIGARVPSLESPILLASKTIVRQAPFRVKKKASILENKSAKSRGLGGRAPIRKVTSSFLLFAGTDPPASDSRAPGADAGDCKSRSSSPAPGTDRGRWRSRRDRSART